jgi:quinoprotein glucose dehydrogenase
MGTIVFDRFGLPQKPRGNFTLLKTRAVHSARVQLELRPLAAWAALLLAACGAPPEPSPAAGPAVTAEYLRGSDWPSYHRDLAGTRYSPLRQISATNVDELRQAWSYPLGGAADPALAGSELTPLVVAGVLYATAADRIVALRADTGAEIWRYVLPQGTPSQRGIAYWPGDAVAGARLYVTAGRALLALDAATGQRAAAFGSDGEVAMPAAYAGAPTRFGDLLIVGSNAPPGGVRAYDVRSGAERWSFTGAPTLLSPASALTVDADRALVYAVFTGPRPDIFYGGERAEPDPHLSSVVALDAHTGARRWHFQTVHHDVWGYDVTAPPALLEVAIAGARRPLLALAGRTGYLYFLDRVTGEPVFDIVETPVPSSDVPGERLSPTQPVPRAPAPIARVAYAADDLVTSADTTTEHAAYCRALRERSGGLQNSGPFTPFRYRASDGEPRSSIVFPGSFGGAGWGGLAADPERGVVYVNTSSEGAIGWLEPNTGDATSAQTGQGARTTRLPYRRTSAVGGPLARFWSHDTAADSAGNEQGGGPAAWPCQKPPWGELVAVAAATGEIAWRVPLGVTEQLPQDRRRTGRLNAGGPIVTAAGLVFIAASNDRRFRAFDARTGDELWVTELPLSAHAVPITYAAADGRQYVAIVAAGRLAIDDAGPADAEVLIAYALP